MSYHISSLVFLSGRVVGSSPTAVDCCGCGCCDLDLDLDLSDGMYKNVDGADVEEDDDEVAAAVVENEPRFIADKMMERERECFFKMLFGTIKSSVKPKKQRNI
jgi:hypothetical protein